MVDACAGVDLLEDLLALFHGNTSLE